MRKLTRAVETVVLSKLEIVNLFLIAFDNVKSFVFVPRFLNLILVYK